MLLTGMDCTHSLVDFQDYSIFHCCSVGIHSGAFVGIMNITTLSDNEATNNIMICLCWTSSTLVLSIKVVNDQIILLPSLMCTQVILFTPNCFSLLQSRILYLAIASGGNMVKCGRVCTVIALLDCCQRR